MHQQQVEITELTESQFNENNTALTQTSAPTVIDPKDEASAENAKKNLNNNISLKINDCIQTKEKRLFAYGCASRFLYVDSKRPEGVSSILSLGYSLQEAYNEIEKILVQTTTWGWQYDDMPQEVSNHLDRLQTLNEELKNKINIIDNYNRQLGNIQSNLINSKLAHPILNKIFGADQYRNGKLEAYLEEILTFGNIPTNLWSLLWKDSLAKFINEASSGRKPDAPKSLILQKAPNFVELYMLVILLAHTNEKGLSLEKINVEVATKIVSLLIALEEYYFKQKFMKEFAKNLNELIKLQNTSKHVTFYSLVASMFNFLHENTKRMPSFTKFDYYETYVIKMSYLVEKIPDNNRSKVLKKQLRAILEDFQKDKKTDAAVRYKNLVDRLNLIFGTMLQEINRIIGFEKTSDYKGILEKYSDLIPIITYHHSFENAYAKLDYRKAEEPKDWGHRAALKDFELLQNALSKIGDKEALVPELTEDYLEQFYQELSENTLEQLLSNQTPQARTFFYIESALKPLESLIDKPQLAADNVKEQSGALVPADQAQLSVPPECKMM